jgi:hypothetical protein
VTIDDLNPIHQIMAEDDDDEDVEVSMTSFSGLVVTFI